MKERGKMRNPTQALKEHYNEVSKIYSKDKILGIFLYGSQNYNIATENSDVDSVAIIIPSIEEVILKAPVSKELHFDNGEHCVIKDIREIIKMWKKQNINFLEILFTDYFLINPEYTSYWNNFLSIRDRIVYYDVDKTIKSISGQAKHTYFQDPTDKKKVANALRMFHFLKAYLQKYPYKRCLIQNWSFIKGIKTGEISITTEILNNIFTEGFEKLKNDIVVKSIPEVGEELDYYLVDLIKGGEI